MAGDYPMGRQGREGQQMVKLGRFLGGLGALLLGAAALSWVASEAGLLLTHNKEATVRSDAWLEGYEKGVAEGKEARPRPGDYRLVQLGQMRRDQFLVDQANGRVWTVVCSKSPDAKEEDGPACNGLVYFDEMYVQGLTPADSPVTIYGETVLERYRELRAAKREEVETKPQRQTSR